MSFKIIFKRKNIKNKACQYRLKMIFYIGRHREDTSKAKQMLDKHKIQ